jgi:hypothetical protein
MEMIESVLQSLAPVEGLISTWRDPEYWDSYEIGAARAGTLPDKIN